VNTPRNQRNPFFFLLDDLRRKSEKTTPEGPLGDEDRCNHAINPKKLII